MIMDYDFIDAILREIGLDPLEDSRSEARI